jgi:hypothetical protein
MAERHKSHDGQRDTDAFIGEEATPGAQGREGGRLAREVGTRSEERRALEPDAGPERVRKADEPDGEA